MKQTIYVLVPAYNVEKYIGICFDSLINQTYSNWICLCMNDGSKDKTWQIMQKYAHSDNRFKIFTQENHGLTKTLNTLLKKVKGPYLYYLDSDDYIHPQTFEILMSVANKTKADVVECAMEHVHSEPSYEHFRKIKDDEVSVKTITDINIFLTNKTRNGYWINKVNKLYKWNLVKNIRFSELLSYEDDYFYATQVHSVIKRKSVINKALYFYRLNPKSMCHSLDLKKYQSAGISRVKLSYDYFIKGKRIPDKYLEDFKDDLANDAYRMIIRKALKKCKNRKLRKELFIQGSKVFKDYIDNNVVEIKRLSFLKRLTVFFYTHEMYFISRILVYIA